MLRKVNIIDEPIVRINKHIKNIKRYKWNDLKERAVKEGF
jgi:hypothetical protein